MGLQSNEPERYARLLLSELGLTHADDLNKILSALRLSVRERPADSFEGALVCRMDRSKGVILLSDSIDDEGRKRFTICHEIGHYILPGHGKVSCKANAIESNSSQLSPHEIDANRVASELLLPTSLIYPIVRNKKATLTLAREFAQQFNTSLTAAALKVVEVTEEASAIVWSTDDRSRWVKRNDNFFKFIPTGELDPKTYAHRLFESGGRSDNEGAVFADSWLNDGSSGDVKLWEESVYFPNYDAVLTLLTQV